MPTPSEPLRLGARAQISAYFADNKRLVIISLVGIGVLIAAIVLVLQASRGVPSWSIGGSQNVTELSPSDLENINRRLAAIEVAGPDFATRADTHLKLLSTLKLVEGRGGLTLDQHLLRFIAAIRDRVRADNTAGGYDMAEQAFNLIDDKSLRYAAARRLGFLTMTGRIAAPERAERLFRIWSAVDRDCLAANDACDGVTHDFSLYFAAHARVAPDAEQAAYLLARRIQSVGARTTAYHEIGTLLMRPFLGDRRDTALVTAANAALLAKRPKVALAAASAMSTRSGGSRDDMLRLVEDTLIQNDNFIDALDAGMAMSNSDSRDMALLRVVNATASDGFAHEAQVAHEAIVNGGMKTVAGMQIGLGLAKAGYAAQALPYLDGAQNRISAMPSGALREAAAAYGAWALAETGDVAAAKQLLAMAGRTGPAQDNAVRNLADEYARNKDVEGLTALAADASPDTAGDLIGRAAVLVARAGDVSRASKMVGDVSGASPWLHAVGRLALSGAMSADWTAAARKRFGLIVPDADNWDSLAYADAALERAAGRLDRASRKLPLIVDAKRRADVAKSIGLAMLYKGNYAGMMAQLGQFTSDDASSRDSLKSAFALEMGKLGGVQQASYIVKSMSDVNARVKAFHALAQNQAETLDRFKALGGAAQPVATITDKPLLPAVQMERLYYAAFDVKQQKLGDFLPALPNSGLTDANIVRQSFQPDDDSGAIQIVPLVNNDFNKKFLTASAVQNDWSLLGATIVMTAQGTRHPVYLHVSKGSISMPQLWEQLVLRGQGDLLHRDGRTYTFRAPVFVGAGSTLSMTGADVGTVRMSTERATFIVNAGNVQMSDITLVGWSEAKAEPTGLTYDTKHDFRPFYIAWSNSNTKVVGSEFLNLGYASGKAYGMTLTYGPITLLQRNVQQVRAPTGTFVENSFRHMLYGFYSYEAYDVQVVGNEYADNIVYGIDPHDRSHKLLFSYNTVYGSQKKHGIIGSRNVEDSWFIGNLTFDNKGSGMMMDRYAGRNILYANTAFDNHANGISIYESPCNIISSNSVFKNGRSGITVRNSWNVGIFHNKLNDNRNLGIEGYAVEFVTKPGAPERNLLLDPYEQFVSTSAASNQLKNNHQGAIGMTGMGSVLLQGNTIVGSAKRLFLNDLRVAETDLGARQAAGVMVASGCPRPKRSYSCPFITDGYLSRELSAVPKFGRPLPSCPGNTIVNASFGTGRQSYPVAPPVDDEGSEEDMLQVKGAAQ